MTARFEYFLSNPSAKSSKDLVLKQDTSVVSKKTAIQENTRVGILISPLFCERVLALKYDLRFGRFKRGSTRGTPSEVNQPILSKIYLNLCFLLICQFEVKFNCTKFNTAFHKYLFSNISLCCFIYISENGNLDLI